MSLLLFANFHVDTSPLYWYCEQNFGQEPRVFASLYLSIMDSISISSFHVVQSFRVVFVKDNTEDRNVGIQANPLDIKISRYLKEVFCIGIWKTDQL